MESNSYATDIQKAKAICEQLRAGKRDAILDLYYSYHQLFLKTAIKKIYDQQKAEDVVSDCWVELMNGNAICAYQGQSSLKTYLWIILRRRVIDQNRKNGRTKRIFKDVSEKFESGDNINEVEDRFRRVKDQESDYEEDLDKKRFIKESLLSLERSYPRDANIIRNRLKGMTYEDIAKMELGYSADQQELKKKTEAIRQEFYRNSMTRFKYCADRVREEFQWTENDVRSLFESETNLSRFLPE